MYEGSLTLEEWINRDDIDPSRVVRAFDPDTKEQDGWMWFSPMGKIYHLQP